MQPAARQVAQAEHLRLEITEAMAEMAEVVEATPVQLERTEPDREAQAAAGEQEMAVVISGVTRWRQTMAEMAQTVRLVQQALMEQMVLPAQWFPGFLFPGARAQTEPAELEDMAVAVVAVVADKGIAFLESPMAQVPVVVAVVAVQRAEQEAMEDMVEELLLAFIFFQTT